MDEIQKILVKAGRKDLAQEYYKKTAFGGGLSGRDITKEMIANLKPGKMISFLETNAVIAVRCTIKAVDDTRLLFQIIPV